MVTSEIAGSPAARHFDEHGYVILEGLFSEQEIAPISDEVDRLLDGRATYIPEKDLIWEPNSNPPRLRNAFRLHLQSDFFLNVAKHPPLLSVVGELIGYPLRLYGSQVFAKPASVGTAVPMHQDMPYWPFEPYDMLSAWIALDDSRIENGCVRMVAGSHKLGMLPHAATDVPGNSLGLSSHPGVEALPEHPIEVRRGSCVLHHSLTAHRSEPNRSTQARRGLVYVFMGPAVQLTDPSRMKGPAIFPVVS